MPPKHCSLDKDARAPCSDKPSANVLLGSQGKVDNSVYVGQWKSNSWPLTQDPTLLKETLAEGEKQTHRSFEPPAIMAGYASAPDKYSVTVFLHSCREQLMGQEQKALSSEE